MAGARIAKLLVAVAGLAGIAALLTPHRPGVGTLVWNFTASAPIGLYRIRSGSWAMGERVAVRPSGDLARQLRDAGVLDRDRLLVKRVAAGAGDEVCRDGLVLRINGVDVAKAKEVDHAGEALPQWSGCRSLVGDEILLLGETGSSFDGRYLGPVNGDSVVGSLQDIVVVTPRRG